MDPSHLTQKSQEALHDAQTKALRYGHPEVDGVGTRPGIAVPEDLDAHQSYRRRDAPAVIGELRERLVADLREIHLDAVDQVLERTPREIKLRNARFEGAPLRRERDSVRRVAGGQLIAPQR